MAHWIFIEEGTYPLEAAFLLNPGHTAVTLQDAVLEVYQDGTGERRVRGQGMVVNLLLVELHEDYDEIDLLVDLGGRFKYRIKTPLITAGKVFAPHVKSLLQFAAQGPLDELTEKDYAAIRSRLVLLDQREPQR